MSTAFMIEQPNEIFYDLSGNPLDGGYIYIGKEGFNPETTPAAIYLDESLTLPISQPVRTAGGFISLPGGYRNIFSSERYSMTIRDKNKSLLFSSLSWQGVKNGLATPNGAGFVGNAAIYIEDVLNADVTNIPDSAIVIARTRGGYTQGGGIFYYSSSSSLTSDNGLIFTPTTGTGRLIRQGYTVFGFNGAVNPCWYGVVFDGTTDNASALQACITNNDNVLLPDGVAISSAALTKTGMLTLRGAGSGASIISFTGSTQGISITQTASTDTYLIEGIGLKTNAPPSSGFVGLKIDGSSQITGTSGSYTTLGDRARSRGKIDDLQCFGSNTDTFGWGIGLQFLSVMNHSVRNYKYMGAGGLSDWAGVGILANGNGMYTDWSLSRIWIFHAAYGVLQADYSEGIHIYDFELVNTKYGIYCGYVSGYSTLDQSLCKSLAVYIINGHSSSRRNCITIYGANQSRISNVLLYLISLSSDPAANGILMSACNSNTISDFTVSGDNASNTKLSNYGVTLTGSGYNKIKGGNVSNVGSAVTLVSSSQFNSIDEMNTYSCNYIVSGDSSSTRNDIGPEISGTSLISKLNVNSDNMIAGKTFSTSSVQTLTATSSFGFSITPPTGMFSETPKNVSITPCTKIAGYSVQVVYNYDSSSSSYLSFTVYPVDASTLSAVAFRFAILVNGI